MKSSSRHRNRSYNVVEDSIWIEALQLRLRLEDNAMAQDRQNGALHVVGNDVIAVFKGRECLRHAQQADRGAGACAERQHRPLARAANKIENVSVKIVLHADGANFIARGGKKLRRERLDLRIFEQVSLGRRHDGARASAARRPEPGSPL